jgi:transposase-like protein
MDTQQKHHDRAFRVRAVRKLIETGADLHQVAADLGVIPRQLSIWLRRYAVASESEGGRWRLKTSEEIVQELRRDSEHLKQELDRLRQVVSVSLFSFS